MKGQLLVSLMFACLNAFGASLSGNAPVLDVSILEDSTGRLGIEDVASMQSFTPLAGSTANFGYARSAWWFRIMPGLDPQEDLLLEVAYTQNDQLDFFLPIDGQWRRIEAGDKRKRPNELLAYPTPLIALPEALEQPVFLRVASSGSMMVPLRLHQRQSFFEQAMLTQFGFGLYYAFLLAMALYNLFLLLAIRDRAYAYYVLYLVGLLVFQSSLFGHASLWLWPEWPTWTHLSTVTGVAVMIAAGTGFVSRLAQIAEHVPLGHRSLQLLALMALATLPLMVIDYRSALMCITILGALSVLLFYPIPVVLSYLRGCRQSRFLALGLILFLPGVVLIVMRVMGLISPSWWSEHALQTGTAVEVMLFSLALADRINTLQADKLAAQQEIISAHDSERRRIAADLHDGLGQDLLLLANRLRPRTRGDPSTEGLRKMVDDVLAELRASVNHLHPHQLDRLGLKRALEAILDEAFSNSEIKLDKDIQPPEMSDEQALQLYRIIQEAVSNILRHSSASQAKVRLVKVRRRIELEISDNGVGLGGKDHGTGLGLNSIRLRAQILGGRLRLGNLVPSGTRLTLEIPHHDP